MTKIKTLAQELSLEVLSATKRGEDVSKDVKVLTATLHKVEAGKYLNRQDAHSRISNFISKNSSAKNALGDHYRAEKSKGDKGDRWNLLNGLMHRHKTGKHTKHTRKAIEHIKKHMPKEHKVLFKDPK